MWSARFAETEGKMQFLSYIKKVKWRISIIVFYCDAAGKYADVIWI